MSDLVGKTLGKYRIVARLGRGGMADVYQAYQPGLDRYVAIKVMHSHLAEESDFIGRFKREASAVASLRHPNIVQVYDFDVESDLYYMVMEYVEGPTLKAELKERTLQGQLFTLHETACIFSALASAIDYAHARGMVHRDLKPANIMFTKDGQVVLTDFGIARIVGATRYTMTGAISGTPAYMSPEQGQGERGDERSDIYSLGIILYEMVMGRVPYDADTPYAIIMKHINEPLPMPRALNPQLPEAVERVILKALSKNPEDRYPTAGEMAKALREAVGIGTEQTLTAMPILTVAPAPRAQEPPSPEPVLSPAGAEQPGAMAPTVVGAAPRAAPGAVPSGRGVLRVFLIAGVALIVLAAAAILILSRLLTASQQRVEWQASNATQAAVSLISTATAQVAQPTVAPDLQPSPTQARVLSVTFAVTAVTAPPSHTANPEAGGQAPNLVPTTLPDAPWPTAAASDEAGGPFAAHTSVAGVATRAARLETPLLPVATPTPGPQPGNELATAIASTAPGRSTTTRVETPGSLADALTAPADLIPTETATWTPTSTPTPSPMPSMTPTPPPPLVSLEVNPALSELLPGQMVVLTLNISGQGYTIHWMAARGLLSAEDTPAVIYTAPDAPGADIVTVQVSNAGGVTTKSVSFNVVLPTSTPTATSTPTEIPTLTPTPTHTVTHTPTPSDTYTPAPTATASPTPASVWIPTDTSVPVVPDTPLSEPPTDTPVPRAAALGGRLAVPIDDGAGAYKVMIYQLPEVKVIGEIPKARQPNYSSDGRLVVNGEGGSQENIWQYNGDGTGGAEMSASPLDHHPFWKFDAAGVVYDNPELNCSKRPCPEWHIFVQPGSDRPDTRTVADKYILAGDIFGDRPLYPLWAVDDYIIFRACDIWPGGSGGSHCGIWRSPSWATAGGTGFTLPARITETDDIPTDTKVGILVFMSQRDGNWEVYVTGITGGPATNLSNYPGQDGLGTLSPDGQWVAFVSDRDGWGVWVVPTSGGPAQRLPINFLGWGGGERDWTNERISWGP